MDFILYFLMNWSRQTAVIIDIISCFILIAFVLPLQLKRIPEHNGLKKLKIQLFLSALTLFIVNMFSIFILIDMILRMPTTRILNGCLQLVNSIGFLAIAIIGYAIYHQQYTKENIKKHEQFEKEHHSK